MKIGAREIGGGQPCYIIAEAGTNHAATQRGQRRWIAHDLINAALAAGANAIKFQMFISDEPLFCPLDGDDRRRSRWYRSSLSFAEWGEIKDYAESRGITFLASAFQPTAVQWLKQLSVAAYKVASRAAASYPYDEVPGPFIISTGMGAPPISAPVNSIWLLCLAKYPAPLDEARWADDWHRGLSDHSGTIWPGLDAMARGCPMLEVHFAIDKENAGNDAPVCLTVDQLKLLCEARDAFAALRPN